MPYFCSIFFISCQKLYLSNTLSLGNAKSATIEALKTESLEKLYCIAVNWQLASRWRCLQLKKQRHLPVESFKNLLHVDDHPS